MKKIIILGLALCSMISCKKYDDSELWDAVNKLQADTVKENNSSTVVAIEKGAIKAAFSVAEGKQVYFSQGNLQYQPSTKTWRFAYNQWDIIGDENANISEDYTGWIDLFGWGTSGWAESGAICYQPWSKSSINSDYYVGGSYEKSLTGVYANADWGVYNAIANGGNEVGLWRTLTKDEWLYVINERPNADKLKGIGTVNGINGLILLPNDWILPEGLIFNTNLDENVPENNNRFQIINCFNNTQWVEMEKRGAVFFPCAGNRKDDKPNGVGLYNGYWSSTIFNTNESYLMAFSNKNYTPNHHKDRFYGRAVRLVQDVK